MKMNVKFQELNTGFKADMGQLQVVADGGYERGYAAGYEQGNTEGYTKGHTDGVAEGYAAGYEEGTAEGYTKGHADGLKARTFEVWTITLVDGTIVEKEVALL